MKHLSVLVMTVAVGFVSACSDDDGGDGQGGASARAGTSGAAGTGGAAGAGGAAGTAGRAGSNSGGVGGSPVPPPPALGPDAETVACPAQINGSLDLSDGSQTGRHSRVVPVSACGTPKGFPGNAADPTNPHLFDVYRFENPSTAPVCFAFTLTDSGAVSLGADAGADAAAPDGGAESPLDAGGTDASVAPPLSGPAPAKYLTAYGTFYPTDLTLEYLGDVGDTLTAPQTMGITVPAGETIDVVVYAVDNAPAGVGSYTLSCATQ